MWRNEREGGRYELETSKSLVDMLWAKLSNALGIYAMPAGKVNGYRTIA